MALELARRFQRELAAKASNITAGGATSTPDGPKPIEVRFLSLALSDSALSWPSATVAVKETGKSNLQRMIAALTTNCLIAGKEVQPPSPDLLMVHVLATMFGETKARRILILNIDECQRDVQTCAEMLRVIRDANLTTSQYCIVPVTTGIWLQDDDVKTITTVSETSPWTTVLHFLPGSRADQLVHSLLESVGGLKTEAATALLKTSDAQALIRDTAGWARAAVTLALRIGEQHTRLAGRINWQRLESLYMADMLEQYGDKPFAKLLNGLPYLSKLLDVALSPHAVKTLIFRWYLTDVLVFYFTCLAFFFFFFVLNRFMPLSR